MALSPSALSEIRTELETLHRLKVQIDERVKALEAILAPLDLGSVGLPATPKANGVPFGLRPPEPSSSANNGLRAAVLEVLRRSGPKRAAEVAKELSAQGYDANGSATPLTTRVYNDLWRMSQKGLVTSNDGIFGLK